MKTKNINNRNFILLLILSLNFFIVSSVKAQSALGQLQTLAGQGVSVPAASSPSSYSTSSSRSSSSSSSSSYSSGSLQQQIAVSIFSALLTNLFSDNSSNKATGPSPEEIARAKQLEEQHQKELAELLAKQRAEAQAKHDKMMREFKPLYGSSDLKFKSMLDDNYKSPVHFNCKLLSFTGKVVVVKQSGDTITLSQNQSTSVELHPGDWIATGGNGQIKMHFAFENGGKDMFLKPNSAINITTNENGTQEPQLIKGDMSVVNSKTGEENSYHQDLDLKKY